MFRLRPLTRLRTELWWGGLDFLELELVACYGPRVGQELENTVRISCKIYKLHLHVEATRRPSASDPLELLCKKSANCRSPFTISP